MAFGQAKGIAQFPVDHTHIFLTAGQKQPPFLRIKLTGIFLDYLQCIVFGIDTDGQKKNVLAQLIPQPLLQLKAGNQNRLKIFPLAGNWQGFSAN